MRKLLFLLLAVPLCAQDDKNLDNRKDWPTVLASDHYEIRSTCSQAEAQKLLKHMELVFVTYTKLFALAKAPSKKLVIILFKDEKEYEAHGETPGGSVAYYDKRHLVGFYHEKKMFNYFGHEGMHQFTDISLKDIDRAPMWFTEGMAECIGNHEVRDGKLYMCALNGVIAQENLPIIRRMIKNGKHVPIKKLVTMEYRDFMMTSGMYPQSWSFCHFLLTYPNAEDRKAQIPNGKYWTVLSTFIQLMSKRATKLEDALKASFQLKGKALDYDELEKEWKEYVLKMENDGTKEEK